MMRIVANIVLSVILLILQFCCDRPNKTPIVCNDKKIEGNTVSFSEIYKNKDLDGKVIILAGIFSYAFENVAIYPDSPDKGHKGIWLSLSDSMLKNDSLLNRLNGKKVIVAGQLYLKMKGHLNSYYGTLNNIICFKGE